MTGRPALQQHDLISIWEAVASLYDVSAASGPDYRAYLQIILECVGDPLGKAFCEVGCGSGTTSALLRQMGARVAMVDIAPRALNFAQKHFAQLNLQAQFSRQNGLQMGFQEGAFDVVWNGGVIEHFTDDGKVALLHEMWRVVRPGGVLLVKAPNACDIPFMLGKTLDRWRGRWQYGYEDDLTMGRLQKLAARAGLQNANLFAYNPIVGWWFVPYGKAITQRLGLNTVEHHARHAHRGHVICLIARKASS